MGILRFRRPRPQNPRPPPRPATPPPTTPPRSSTLEKLHRLFCFVLIPYRHAH
ncbi:hypothetical protein DM01DRAFT_1340366 [Hesseltinella vesiculosa]|uniref:Uncharacterized protein n=1 Tax=Hesseltinella vesiculosa TaxID=101127 RepID=A0A1X2G4C8_9FUNG|nr:hypothetical protein DM01DRAFT_1340366 [Hesseltinella vesiculosa]